MEPQTKRDLIMVGLGFGIGFLILTTIGRRTMMTAAGLGKAEVNRALSKLEKRAEKRSKLKS